MADDDRTWGVCPSCRVLVDTLPRHGNIAAHNVGEGVSTYRCPGSGQRPADPAKVPYRERWWAERARTLAEKARKR